MIKFNLLILSLGACLPVLMAYFWYQPSIAKKWLSAEKQLNLDFKWSIGTMIALYILSLMYSISISYQVIHQLHFQSMLYSEVGFDKGQGEAINNLNYILELYGKNYRSFGHGMFHGFLNSIFIILPVLFFQKLNSSFSWKVLLYHWAFWAICGMIMGGIICELY